MSDNPQIGAAAAALGGGTDARSIDPPVQPNPTGTVQPRNDNPASPTDITGAGSGAGGWKTPDFAKDWAPEDQGYLEKKGYSDPRKIYDAYRAAERTISGEHVSLPKDWNNADEVNKFYDKAGRPESAEKYVAPKDADANFFKAMAPEFHQAGLTQRQLDRVAAGYNKVAQAQMEQQQTQWINDQNEGQSKLEREWGNRTPAEVEHNRRAMRALGMSVDEATAYMRNGTEKFLRLLNMAGHMLAEDDSGNIASDDTLGFGNTPNRAAADLNELRNNKEFMAKLASGDKVAKAKYDRLRMTAAEGGMVRNTIKSGFKKVVSYE